MSTHVLLDTRTANFLDLVGNGRRYAVPSYQRDYSWQEEHWDDLWNDILAMQSEPKDKHYMGAVVVQAESDRDFLVIDGQQRLATLSILALAIIHQLQKLADDGHTSEANRERAQSLRARFIGEKDPASLVESSKLTLNENDHSFYEDYLVQLRPPINPRGLSRSNRLLWQCFQWFDRKLEAMSGCKPDGQKVAELLNETVARQLLFIVITVDDELNAYTVFETLNARGLELSATDLLKNYLFSRVRVPSDLKALQRRWQSLIATVRPERFPTFLRYHLLCETPKVRSNRLFKIVRERVNKPKHVFDLIAALEARAELFTALADESHEFWIERRETRQLIRERILLRGQQSVPLLFAAWEKLPEKEFDRVLKLVNVFTFRFTTVCGLNTNDLEPLYHRAAKAVLDGTADSASLVFQELKTNYVDDDQFRRNFELLELRTSGQSKRLVRYILSRLEADGAGRSVDYETDSGTIEHILPENPADEWTEMITENDWARCAYRLGNLTLMEASRNRRIGNSLYADKVAEYADSTYWLTSQIAIDSPDEWTVARIEKRQENMAKRATHLWRSDFQ